MKADFYKLNQVAQSLNPLLQQKLPVKAAYWLNKFAENVFKALEDYEKKRMEILGAYAETESEDSDKIKMDDSGQAVFKSPEDKENFLKDVEESRKEEKTIEIKHLLTLGNLGNAEMTANDLAVLEELFVQEEEQAAQI